MLKYICDLCENQIKEGEENGTLAYIEKTFIFDAKHLKQDAVKKTEMIFCSQCLQGIKSYLSGQKSLKK